MQFLMIEDDHRKQLSSFDLAHWRTSIDFLEFEIFQQCPCEVFVKHEVHPISEESREGTVDDHE